MVPSFDNLRRTDGGTQHFTSGLLREQLVPLLQFLVVGGIAFLIDYLTFNLLVFAAPWPGGHGPMFDWPMLAKLLSILLASAFTYVGNRLWTFSKRGSRVTGGRLLAFVLLNIVAMAMQELCLGFSRYALGLHSWLSDNISGTLVGQALATVFRYVTYRRWVFPDDRSGSSLGDPHTDSQQTATLR
ncbi:MAG: GtrA family protein [Propionibacterium sp.]